MERLLKKGSNWRVGWDSEPKKYQGLIGSDSWAIELTAAEFKDFYRLLQQLVNTMAEMERELMDEERIACEAESNLLWMEVEGYPHAYDLRLILVGDRRCEGNWQAGAAVEMVRAIERMMVF
ncbi:DUF1818 family protein [Myxosarcina sp. GI1]|uniref:DUF1818 family protein n=1 Tax=Myxosarcina sp. GI1 TaxID=1541065 RepID=UPI00056D7F2F|nr:DUF1818 family protein [Myxosarcina sp. GI1]